MAAPYSLACWRRLLFLCLVAGHGISEPSAVCSSVLHVNILRIFLVVASAFCCKGK